MGRDRVKYIRKNTLKAREIEGGIVAYDRERTSEFLNRRLQGDKKGEEK